MTRKELDQLLTDVSVGNIKSTDAAAKITKDMEAAAARGPWRLLIVAIVGLVAVLLLSVKGCVEYNMVKVQKACPACSCPEPNCDAVWERARKHYAKEMLRGLRLKSGCYSDGLENER